MATKAELIEQSKALEAQIKDLEAKAWEARKQNNAVYRQISLMAGFEAFGLMPGDVIEVTKKTYKGPKTYRLRVDNFGLFHDDYTALSISGTLVKKDGKLGERRESCHPTLREYSWRKVE